MVIPAMGVLPCGEEGAEEHEELEIYLWVRSVGAGVAGGGVSSESSRPRAGLAALRRRSGGAGRAEPGRRPSVAREGPVPGLGSSGGGPEKGARL